MNCTVLSADNMECVICAVLNVCTMYTQPSPATGGWVTANLPKYRQLTDSHRVRTRSMCLHSLRINFYVYSQFWQFYRLWPGRMVRAGSSRFPSGHQSFTSYRERGGRRAAVAERAEGWTLRMTTFLWLQNISIAYQVKGYFIFYTYLWLKKHGS